MPGESILTVLKRIGLCNENGELGKPDIFHRIDDIEKRVSKLENM